MSVRQVEGLKHRIARVAAYEHIETAAIALCRVLGRFPIGLHARGNRGKDTGPAQFRIQQPGNCQCRIADDFSFQALPGETPQQLVLRVDFGCSLTIEGTLSIGIRVEDEPVQVLDAPVVSDELRGQPVQQLRVAGQSARKTQIAGCFDDSPTEVVVPDPVHHDACRQGIVRISDPVGQCRTPARGLHPIRRHDFGRAGIEEGGETGFYLFPACIVSAPGEDKRRGRLAARVRNADTDRQLTRVQIRKFIEP